MPEAKQTRTRSLSNSEEKDADSLDPDVESHFRDGTLVSLLMVVAGCGQCNTAITSRTFAVIVFGTRWLGEILDLRVFSQKA
jgi:hypothetical protein